jgi:hypothetical protein
MKLLRVLAVLMTLTGRKYMKRIHKLFYGFLTMQQPIALDVTPSFGW